MTTMQRFRDALRMWWQRITDPCSRCKGDGDLDREYPGGNLDACPDCLGSGVRAERRRVRGNKDRHE